MKFKINVKHDGVTYQKGEDVPKELQAYMTDLGYVEAEEKAAPKAPKAKAEKPVKATEPKAEDNAPSEPATETPAE